MPPPPSPFEPFVRASVRLSGLTAAHNATAPAGFAAAAASAIVAPAGFAATAVDADNVTGVSSVKTATLAPPPPPPAAGAAAPAAAAAGSAADVARAAAEPAAGLQGLQAGPTAAALTPRAPVLPLLTTTSAGSCANPAPPRSASAAPASALAMLRRASTTAASPRGFHAFEELLRSWVPPAGAARPGDNPNPATSPFATPGDRGAEALVQAPKPAASAGGAAPGEAEQHGLTGLRSDSGGTPSSQLGGAQPDGAAPASEDGRTGSRAASRELASCPATPSASPADESTPDSRNAGGPAEAPRVLHNPFAGTAVRAAVATSSASNPGSDQPAAPTAPTADRPVCTHAELENLLRGWAAPALPAFMSAAPAGPARGTAEGSRPGKSQGNGHSAPAAVTAAAPATAAAEGGGSGGLAGAVQEPGRATSAPAERPPAPHTVAAFEHMLRGWDAPQLPQFATAAAPASPSCSAAASDPGVCGASPRQAGREALGFLSNASAGAPRAGSRTRAACEAAPVTERGHEAGAAPAALQRQSSTELYQERFARWSAANTAAAASVQFAPAAGAPAVESAQLMPVASAPIAGGTAPLQRQSSTYIYQDRYARRAAVNTTATASVQFAPLAGGAAAAVPAQSAPMPRVTLSGGGTEMQRQSSTEVYRERYARWSAANTAAAASVQFAPVASMPAATISVQFAPVASAPARGGAAPMQRQSSMDVYQERYARWSAANTAAAASVQFAPVASAPVGAALQRSGSSSSSIDMRGGEAGETERQSSGEVYQVGPKPPSTTAPVICIALSNPNLIFCYTVLDAAYVMNVLLLHARSA